MTVAVMKGTQKRTFTIKNNFAEKLNNYKNKSKIINSALNLYFEREKYLDKAEKEFFETFEIEKFSKEEENYISNLDSYKRFDKTISEMTF